MGMMGLIVDNLFPQKLRTISAADDDPDVFFHRLNLDVLVIDDCVPNGPQPGIGIFVFFNVRKGICAF